MIERVVAWKQEYHWENPKFGCESDWIKVEGLPLNMWNQYAFEMIGSHFGGLLEVEDNTKKRVHLNQALLKVKGSDSVFFPKNLNIFSWGKRVQLTISPVEIWEETEEEEEDYTEDVVSQPEEWRSTAGEDDIADIRKEKGDFENSNEFFTHKLMTTQQGETSEHQSTKKGKNRSEDTWSATRKKHWGLNAVFFFS